MYIKFTKSFLKVYKRHFNTRTKFLKRIISYKNKTSTYNKNIKYINNKQTF